MSAHKRKSSRTRSARKLSAKLSRKRLHQVGLLRSGLATPATLAACSFICRLAASGQDLQTNSVPESTTPTSTVPFFNNPQSEPASASGYLGMQPATPFAGTSQLSVPPVTQAPAANSAGLLHWGFIHLYPHVSYDVSYGNSLQSAPGQSSDTVINEVSPGMLMRLGDHWTLDYTPTLRFYSSHQFQNGVDHIVSLNGFTTYEDWSLRFSQGYSSTSQPLIETASQLDQEVYSTSLNAAHSLGSKLSLELGANQNLRYVNGSQQAATLQGFSDTREWSTLDWLSYQFAPRLSAGIGAGFTYDNMSVGPDMTSEQANGRVQWSPTQKLAFTLSGGADYRQFLNSRVPNLLSPIFSAAVQYQLFDTTSFSLSASRSVTPSYFQDAVSQVTTVTAALHQRLFQRFSLDVSGGYSSNSYDQTATVQAQPSASNYDMTSFSIRLSTVFLKKISSSIFFQKNFVSSNSSSASAALFNYDTTQVGLSLGYQF